MLFKDQSFSFSYHRRKVLARLLLRVFISVNAATFSCLIYILYRTIVKK